MSLTLRRPSPRRIVAVLGLWLTLSMQTVIVHASMALGELPASETAVSSSHLPAHDCPLAADRSQRLADSGHDTANRHGGGAGCIVTCAAVGVGLLGGGNGVVTAFPATVWSLSYADAPPTVAQTPPFRPPRT